MASSSKLTIRLNRINSVAEGGIRGEHDEGRWGEKEGFKGGRGGGGYQICFKVALIVSIKPDATLGHTPP